MATEKKPKQGSTEKGPKVDRLRERGKARQSALDKYSEKLRNLTPRQRMLMRMASILKLVDNSLRGYSQNSMVYKNLIKIKATTNDVSNFFDIGLGEHELNVSCFWEKDEVVLKKNHKTPSLKKYEGKRLKVKFSDEDTTTVKCGKEEIDIKTRILRRPAAE